MNPSNEQQLPRVGCMRCATQLQPVFVNDPALVEVEGQQQLQINQRIVAQFCNNDKCEAFGLLSAVGQILPDAPAEPGIVTA